MNTAAYLHKSSRILQTCAPIIQAKRFRGKINIQRPRQPHYNRALFNAVTQPKIIEPTMYDLCYNDQLPISSRAPLAAQKTDLENPYERIIAKDIQNWFNSSQMIMVYHMNSINSDDLFNARVAFHRENMQLKTYGKSLMKLALKDSPYKVMLQLFDAKNCIVFSPEQNIGKLLKISKKIPQLILMTGIVENRLMSKTQIMEYAALPNLQIVRAQFVAVLGSIGGRVVNDLEAHQKNFVGLLDSHQTALTSKSESSESNGETEK